MFVWKYSIFRKRSTLIVKHVGPRDAGTYTCQGSNIAGTSSDKTVVTIRDAGVKYFNLSDILPSSWLYSFIKLMAYCLQNLERNISQKMVQNTLSKLTYLWTLQTQNKNNLKSFLSCGDKWSLHVSYWLLLPQRREMSVLSVHRRTCLQVRKHTQIRGHSHIT